MRGRGGFIGANVTPAASSPNSAASGMWNLREAESLKRAGTWPSAPPGGVGSGLQLWLDASDASTLFDATTGGSLVAADGGVARWQDKSGNARHATQGTAGSRPTRKTGIKNGLAVLRFDGSNDVMNLPTSFRWWPAGTILTVLANLGSSTVPDAPWYAANNADNPELRLVASSTSGYWYYNGSYKLNTAADHYDSIGTGSLRTIVLNNTAYKSYSNGVLKNSTTLTSAVPANNPATHHSLGGYDYSIDLKFYAGIDIAELIIYNSALSDTDRAAVESYLLAKWGIA